MRHPFEQVIEIYDTICQGPGFYFFFKTMASFSFSFFLCVNGKSQVDAPNIKDSLKPGVFLRGRPPCAPARRRRRSYAIPLCCPPVVKAGMDFTFLNAFAAAQTNWW